MIKLPDNIFIESDNVVSVCEKMDTGFDVDAFEIPENSAPGEEQQLAENTEKFFSPGGALMTAAKANGRECEFRPQQLAMAKAIAETVISGRNLAVEAPTGVGKSFAYLVPLVYRSRYAARPALISTETINLQEQLIDKDIPLLKELTGIDFKAALAKGRSNYLCKRRLFMVSGDNMSQLIPRPSMETELEHLVKWADKTEDGERDSLDCRLSPELWPMVCCEAGNCAGPKCSFFRQCFYYKARRQWEEADIIVANHALFFTDMAMRGGDSAGALLPNYGTVVIDEAHTLEDNAAEHLGLHISRAGITGMLNRLYNPSNARGLLMKPGEKALALRQVITAVYNEVPLFFRQFEEFLEHKESDESGSSSRRVRDCGRFTDTITEELKVLQRLLMEFLDDIEEDGSFKSELESQLDKCKIYIDGIRTFLAMEMNNAVYYIELDRGSVVLNAAPLNVAELLYELLFNQDYPVILSSATLTVRNSFDFYCGRIGFGNGDTLLLDSPFSREQALVCIPRSMPEPQHQEYHANLTDTIPNYIDRTEGKAFVLFTSYSSMRRCAETLRPYFAQKNITLLVQGEDMTRSAMLKNFREDINSVLFGTDSFWTGVDVPGEALSNVIVTKLPFPSPGMPLVEARGEKIEAEGGSSFRNYALPTAVLKFRQGVGRLIRGRNDRGIIVILDRRVISKGYGRSFLESLPYPVSVE